MSNFLTENQIEQIALDIFRDELIYNETINGAELSPEGSQFEREYSEVVLPKRLKQAIDKFNPSFPEDAKEEALKKVLRIVSPNLISGNEEFHKFLTEGVDVTFRNENNEIRTDKIWLIDFQNPENNEFIAVNQFTIIENRNNKRPDLIVFVNGLPLVVFEIKNGTDETTNLQQAYNQLQTYKQLIPSLFNYNALLVITDGFSAHAGTVSSDFTRFMQWKSISGTQVEITNTTTGMDVLIRGMLNKRTILDLIRHFIVFEKTKEKTIKKVAAYHQYFAVNKALEKTITATLPEGDKRAGVIWHTQGSGKSLSMVFYTGKMVLAQELNNPTIVVITDRNDLDQQLFDTFSSCQQIIRQNPVQAESRLHLKELLNIPSGRVIFTTIQKFLTVTQEYLENSDKISEPVVEYQFAGEPQVYYVRRKDLQLNNRRNIIVIADEAHRSQYDFVDGYARCMRDALPNATFIGFTGTPIDKEDRSTKAIFGDYIDIYDIQQAVKDGATVPIYYESRLAKIELNETERQIIDEKIEHVFSEEDELTNRQKLKAKWTKKEAIVGSEKRIKQIAKDIVEHFCKRIEVLEGKAMIVCMSRRICVELHNEIIKIRPDWYHPEDNQGFIKVIMTGSASDPLEWQEHIRNKPRRQSIGDRLKEPKDGLKIAIVRDMWLTGFDAPALHTLYVDKPMNGHNLMQAIARVNRVFGDKTGGLVVDYIGIAQDLKRALINYSDSGGKGQIDYDQEDAVNKMLEIFEQTA
jgi:type I restriction enzyme R subunit